ncbi:RagB/SusD family nutrient uptake outer membrane protein [Mangrovibacterium marinum]|uniref:Putative outer membrane starch-binding protein n=1 Tax=Mangrovibacterium marinum TaxID=1639118 RepID=A0A2T5BY16_9BACT|nr:RagB/SusD family nutrient uptake outer membrane protein [Mangrovibacterium marinum]PTN06291.1 putative outer membrane starch-binding protein [Mangrovibacterium marinum]
MNQKYSIKKFMVIALAALSFTSCNDFLDREPLSNVTPNDYLWSEADLAAYTINQYDFPTHSGWGPGTFATDNNTDNQATSSYSTRWVPGEWRVPQSGGDWNFSAIRNCNYFLETVLPRWQAGEISGNADNIDHYVGEAYFLRAYEYFGKVETYGDFPIVRRTLKDEMAELKAASVRRPRNEVAHFILSDLDSAIMLLQDNPPYGKNRISKQAAYLMKSRVALHEATWLKYHKGTAQVPGGPGWPGDAATVSGFNIDTEIDYFLTQAMNAAAEVADAVSLVENTKDDGYDSSTNPYAQMFADFDLDGYSEVLLWREYDASLGINHNVNHYVNQNGGNTGFTRGFVDNFVMANGLPIYDDASGYAGDDSTQMVKIDRDNRLQLFMKVPGDLRYIDKQNTDGAPILEGYPDILGINEVRYVTGYALKKGFSYLAAQSEGSAGSTGSIVFRAVEAYLNYIEASYLKSGQIDAKADQYWRAIRERAGVNPDYNVTVNATVMSEEAKNDFAAYSAGQLLTDKVLYNIRRERRCELMAEGLRMFDLKRWRALDQLKTNPYIIEGFKIWGPMQDWYQDEDGNSLLIEAGTPDQTANISKSSESEYMRPYRVVLSSSNQVLDGYRWTAAHYLSPIAIQHFIITAENTSDLTTSTIYQNPGWPLEANSGATE